MPDEGTEGPRAFWSGTISFGLVTVPVNMFAANRSGGVRWRMLDQDGTPLRRRFMCPAENREVGPDDLVRGYEFEEGEYVVVTDEELEGLEPRKSRDIDLRVFVDQDQIEPLYFERSYFLTPAGETNKAYRLLAEVMERKRQAGIATFVMREKEYLVAIFSEGGILRAETLRFQDEVRTPEEVGLAKPAPADEKLVGHVVREIEKIKAPKLKPALLENEDAQRIQKLLQRKRKRHEDTVEIADEETDEEKPIDLVEVLRRSLAAGSPTATSPPRKKRRATASTRKRKTKPRRASSARSGGSPRRRRKTA